MPIAVIANHFKMELTHLLIIIKMIIIIFSVLTILIIKVKNKLQKDKVQAKVFIDLKLNKIIIYNNNSFKIFIRIVKFIVRFNNDNNNYKESNNNNKKNLIKILLIFKKIKIMIVKN